MLGLGLAVFVTGALGTFQNWFNMIVLVT